MRVSTAVICRRVTRRMNRVVVHAVTAGSHRYKRAVAVLKVWHCRSVLPPAVRPIPNPPAEVVTLKKLCVREFNRVMEEEERGVQDERRGQEERRIPRRRCRGYTRQDTRQGSRRDEDHQHRRLSHTQVCGEWHVTGYKQPMPRHRSVRRRGSAAAMMPGSEAYSHVHNSQKAFNRQVLPAAECQTAAAMVTR